ncbi:hypothetical protein [Winogradskyella sp. SM1960]|uniref:hypothetical protein n=1 Tax=Winogradskyella sp. SM1960 TaxID=2865955 RepID=UPI001CD646CD|nr:hypothetical protein [Winogradskyella sp. SM1960]
MLTKHLKTDKVQRLIYGIGLILWIFIWVNDLSFIFNASVFGIYLWQVIIPALLLIGQLIFNNKTLWNILIVYVSLYSLWIIWNIVVTDILIDIQRDYLPRAFWTFEKILNWIIMLTVLGFTNWIIWKIKPIAKIKTK